MLTHVRSHFHSLEEGGIRIPSQNRQAGCKGSPTDYPLQRSGGVFDREQIQYQHSPVQRC